MNTAELNHAIDSLLPKLYGFCVSLSRTEIAAEQLFVDGYTVFVLKDKHFISMMEYSFESNEKRLIAKRYLLNELLKVILDLAQKRTTKKTIDNSHFLEFENFYNLSLEKRAILYLKNSMELTVEDIQEIFEMKRYQVIETLHNAQHGLVKDIHYGKPASVEVHL